MVVLGVPVDGHSVDELHREPGPALLLPRLQDAGDARVIQSGEDLGLEGKPPLGSLTGTG